MELKPGYEQTEVGVIPADWDTPVLGEIFTFKNGLNKGKKFFGYGTPIVNYMDVYQYPGLFARDLQGRVDVSKQELKTFEVRKGDVFFTRTSETVEEIGISSVMLDEPRDTVFSGFVLRAHPKDESLNDQFKKYCFAPSFVRKQITSKSTYTTRALTNGRVLSGVAIARPPKSEQHAIAGALGDVDALIGALEKLIAKKRDLKQAAMQQLLTGQQRLPGFSGEWEVASLDQIVDRATGFWGAQDRDDRHPRFAQIIRAGDISPGGQLVVTAARFLSETEFSRAQCRLDDLVITTSGNGLGKVWWCDGREDVAASNFVRVLRPRRETIEGRFLSFVLRSEQGQRLLQEHTATSAYPNLRPTYFAAKWVPLPPVPEQTAIAAVLSDMDAELAALEQRLAKTLALKQGMMQELLTGRTRLVGRRTA